MDFEQAIKVVKQGKKVARESWDYPLYKKIEETQPKWLLAMADMQANDWYVVDDVVK